MNTESECVLRCVACGTVAAGELRCELCGGRRMRKLRRDEVRAWEASGLVAEGRDRERAVQVRCGMRE